MLVIVSILKLVHLVFQREGLLGGCLLTNCHQLRSRICVTFTQKDVFLSQARHLATLIDVAT